MEWTDIFTENALAEIFPPHKADQFFEALFGDKDEGAFDIILVCTGGESTRIDFVFQLRQRPGKCLACNLTYGLPQVFQRHPVIDVAGTVQAIAERLPAGHVQSWEMDRTREESSTQHSIPLRVYVRQE